MKDDRGPWYLITALVLGVIFGLLYGWFVNPTRYNNTAPRSLRADFKDRYRALIAASYMADKDIHRATARLDLLEDPDPVAALALQAQRAIAEARPESEVQAITRLMLTLSQGGTPPPLPTATTTQPTPGEAATLSPATHTPTPVVLITDTPPVPATPSQPAATISGTLPLTPTATATHLPTFTPTPTRGAPFALVEQKLVCAPPQNEPILQIIVMDSAENPVPGVEVIIQWPDNHEEHFFTGLQPDLGLGYADFTMAEGIVYLVRLADGGAPVSDLTAPTCETSSGDTFWGVLRLTFVQP